MSTNIKLQTFNGDPTKWKWWKTKTEAVFWGHAKLRALMCDKPVNKPVDLPSLESISIRAATLKREAAQAEEVSEDEQGSGPKVQGGDSKHAEQEQALLDERAGHEEANHILYSLLLAALTEECNKYLTGIEPGDGQAVWVALCEEFEKTDSVSVVLLMLWSS